MNTDNRRSFIRHAGLVGAAAVAAPWIVLRSVVARAGEPGPNDRVTMAFIGCGRQTYRYNIPLFVPTPGVQALAVCDVDTWRVDKAVQRIAEQYKSGRAKGTPPTVDTYVD